METDIRHRFMNNPRVANKVVDELQESGGGGAQANVLKVCRITHAEYEALAEKDQNTLYLFTDDEGE
jgi:hypothetical protein